MFLLRHQDCDGYPSTWGKWKKQPTKDQLKKVMIDYYDEDKSERIAKDLIKWGVADANDSASSQFEIEEV